MKVENKTRFSKNEKGIKNDDSSKNENRTILFSLLNENRNPFFHSGMLFSCTHVERKHNVFKFFVGEKLCFFFRLLEVKH